MRYIKIDYNGYIFPIKTNGPIVTPLAMDEKVALRAVIDGYRCTEVDIKTGKEVKLSIDNFYNNNRFGKMEKDTNQIKNKAETKNETTTRTVEPTSIDKSNNTEKEIVEFTDIDINDSTSNKAYNYNDKKNKSKK